MDEQETPKITEENKPKEASQETVHKLLDLVIDWKPKKENQLDRRELEGTEFIVERGFVEEGGVIPKGTPLVTITESGVDQRGESVEIQYEFFETSKDDLKVVKTDLHKPAQQSVPSIEDTDDKVKYKANFDIIRQKGIDEKDGMTEDEVQGLMTMLQLAKHKETSPSQ